ncbi:MAG: hypothetical protein GXZ15_02325 [Campylobacter sp.]|nr:hypothetical protein [Campylobacter sp.]
MEKFKVATSVIWAVCLVLNFLALAGYGSYEGSFVAIFWFVLSILVLIILYQNIYKRFFLALSVGVVAFLGGFFTSFLYFGFADINALYMAIISAIIAISMVFGVVIF